MTLSPSAKVTVTIAATPLSVNSTIQGTTNACAVEHRRPRAHDASSRARRRRRFRQVRPERLPLAGDRRDREADVQRPTTLMAIQFPLPQGNEITQSDADVDTFPVDEEHVYLHRRQRPAADAVSSCGGSQPQRNCDRTLTSPRERRGNGTLRQTASPSGRAILPVARAPPWQRTRVHRHLTYHSINVTNPNAATGGVDAEDRSRPRAATDVSNWTQQVTAVEASLTSQLNGDLQARANGKAFAVDPSGGGKTVVFAVTPPLPAVNAPYTATDDHGERQRRGGRLRPGRGAQRRARRPRQARQTGTAARTRQARDAAVHRDAGEHDGHRSSSRAPPPTSASPTSNLELTQIAAHRPESRAALRRSSRTSFPAVQSVHVSMSPFQLFYLPLFASRIEITENFVAPSTPTPSPTPSPTASPKPSP